MVQMNNVTMVYENSDVAALDNISLTINEGEFAFLVGPSGSGKTTIIKLLTGEIMASDGEVIVNGFNMGKLKRRKMPMMRRTLGVIFQDFRLIDKIPLSAEQRSNAGGAFSRPCVPPPTRYFPALPGG